MVVIYDKRTNKPIRTEDNTNIPKLPFNMTTEEREEHFKNNNQGYIIIEKELGANIYYYDLVFDENGVFKELIPAQEIKEEGVIQWLLKLLLT